MPVKSWTKRGLQACAWPLSPRLSDDRQQGCARLARLRKFQKNMHHAAVGEYALHLADTRGKPALALAVSALGPGGCLLMPSRPDLPKVSVSMRNCRCFPRHARPCPQVVSLQYQWGHVLLGVGDMTDCQVRPLLTTHAGGSRRGRPPFYATPVVPSECPNGGMREFEGHGGNACGFWDWHRKFTPNLPPIFMAANELPRSITNTKRKKVRLIIDQTDFPELWWKICWRHQRDLNPSWRLERPLS